MLCPGNDVHDVRFEFEGWFECYAYRSLIEMQCGTVELDNVKMLEGFAGPVVNVKHLFGEMYSCH